jgi:hypothetical protein
MSATPKIPGEGVAVCETVDERIEGPGGIWLLQEGDLAPPAAPQLSGTDPASPGSSGTPRILGSAEGGSTVRIYAGPGCSGTPVASGSATELASPGIAVAVAEGSDATFSANATDAADNTSGCSGSIAYTWLRQPTQESVCVVPKVAGKKLAKAKSALKAAGCALGKVTKPRPRKGKKLGRLVVKSSKPGPGASLLLGTPVDLRLGPKLRKAHL